MIGRKLRNRYEIVQHLGDGSTATVYLARDLRLGRDVALKILLPHVSDTARKRFFQEATAAARLNHPNIMAIYDMDDEDGQYFLVVEYVEGRSLAHYVPSPPPLVAGLGAQIARALHYAHERGIIHRDVKPANIQVTPTGSVKLMDLGLALPPEAKRVTAYGMVIGTPAYLSPEQAQGLKLDARTDLYSLGIVLYELAAGRLPFDADDIGALLLQQVRQEATPLRTFAPQVPPALETVIARAMEKQPQRRYPTALAMAEELERAVAGAPTANYDTALLPNRDDYDPNGDTRNTPAIRTAPPPKRPQAIRLVLADDHAVLRRMLANFFETQESVMVVGEASNGEAAVRQTVALLPDVLLLDINMPGMSGLEVLPRVRQEAPSVKVLVLTGREEDWYIVQALRAGANGYLLKSSDEEELLDGILRVVQGQLVLGHGVAEKMVDSLVGQHGGAPTDDRALNETERQVLLYVAGGYENDGIAKRLNLSVPMVIETLARAMNKLGAKDRHDASLRALRANIISLDNLHEL